MCEALTCDTNGTPRPCDETAHFFGSRDQVSLRNCKQIPAEVLIGNLDLICSFSNIRLGQTFGVVVSTLFGTSSFHSRESGFESWLHCQFQLPTVAYPRGSR